MQNLKENLNEKKNQNYCTLHDEFSKRYVNITCMLSVMTAVIEFIVTLVLTVKSFSSWNDNQNAGSLSVIHKI
jgi:flagellar biogenesis protein FliO